MVGETREHTHPRIVGERGEHEQWYEVAEQQERPGQGREEHAERERGLVVRSDSKER